MFFLIPEPLLQPILRHAEKEYPRECCGIIFSRGGRPDEWVRVRPCRNVQDEYHAADPGHFSRDSRTAYFMDPRELLEVQKEARDRGEQMRVIYHSHIESAAYFSGEDARMALADGSPSGEPVYPGVDYLVLSVIQGKVKDKHLFHWDPQQRKFVS